MSASTQFSARDAILKNMHLRDLISTVTVMGGPPALGVHVHVFDARPHRVWAPDFGQRVMWAPDTADNSVVGSVEIGGSPQAWHSGQMANSHGPEYRDSTVSVISTALVKPREGR